ncbi:MAG: hypothetical protein HYV01_01620, partial [Deltaproteobacteria bacterium]|nr:hypothetical protein [Deltaproteobacteria bacterium]
MSGSGDYPTNSTVGHTTVRVLYFGLVRNVVKEADGDISLPTGATGRELVEILVRKHGEALRDA